MHPRNGWSRAKWDDELYRLEMMSSAANIMEKRTNDQHSALCQLTNLLGKLFTSNKYFPRAHLGS